MSTSVSASRVAQTPRQAVEQLRELCNSGAFLSWCAVDKQSGELLSAQARALFAALPSVSPATAVDELVDHGLISGLPQNWRRAVDSPRYSAGRELFVRTTVNHGSEDPYQPVGGFDAKGNLSFTHQAILQGQAGDSFLVQVAGAEEFLKFSKNDVFAWNEAIGVGAAGGQLAGVHMDYNDAIFKAHICAGLIDISADLNSLDLADAESSLQVALIYRLAGRLRMSYAGRAEGYAGSRAGALFYGGIGVCFVQRAVVAGYLQAFSRLLAFDVQVAVGKTLRLGSPHGFVVLTLRPSLRRYVCDPAWSEPLTDLRVAFFGPNWGHDRRLISWEGVQDARVRAEVIDIPEVGL